MINKQGTILVVTPSLGIGGREKIAINTVRCFEKLDYYVILVIFQHRDTEYSFSGKLINLNVPPKKGILGKVLVQVKRSLKLFRLRKKYCVKYVYSLGEAANISNVLSGLTHFGKTIISIHGCGEVKKISVFNFICSKADYVVCIAKDMQHRLLAVYPRLKNTVVIENGYELSTITPLRNENLSSLRIVSMGRLTQVKGFDRLIRSFRIIKQSISDAVLTIIGTGEQEVELKTLAEQNGIHEAVDFKGYLSDPQPVLQENDLYVLTSHEEGFPNSLIEAMHCGLPIIAADCQTGPREILSERYSPERIQGIRHEKYGILVENSANGFEERFAQAVIQLALDREEMNYYNKIGPIRVKEFSLDRYQEKLEQLLKECKK